MTKEEFINELKKIGIEINDIQLNQLEQYYNLLIEWNKKINLTRIIKLEDVYLKHFYDSSSLIKAINLKEKKEVCDLGTGAGFPGIVLKILFPNLNIILVDALEKRTKFLNIVINTLNLKNIQVVHARGEDFIRNNINKFDIITCRAVAKLNIISEICIPGVKVGGYFVPMKAGIEEEIANHTFLSVLNSKIEEIITFNLPYENSIRNLIKIKKMDITPSLYPRKYDKILKNPL